MQERAHLGSSPPPLLPSPLDRFPPAHGRNWHFVRAVVEGVAGEGAGCDAAAAPCAGSTRHCGPAARPLGPRCLPASIASAPAATGCCGTGDAARDATPSLAGTAEATAISYQADQEGVGWRPAET